jgi:hypothetical protein
MDELEKMLERPYACQRCFELPDRCDCLRYRGDNGPLGVCKNCGGLRGQHWVDFNKPLEEGSICPIPTED